MANTKMGFEGQLFYGAAGSTASTLLGNTRDITLTFETEQGDTTKRGDGSAPPIETEDVTLRRVGIEFQMINDVTDSELAALEAAAAAGTPVALRGKDHSAGKGPDGDFILSRGKPLPLRGEQVITFTARPTRQSGRDPLPYV